MKNQSVPAVAGTFSHYFTVDKNVYSGFINTFKDRNPLHVDTDYAQKKGFQEKVMHGAILTGFLSYFIGEAWPEKNVIVHSYNIQYVSPVYLDDQLHFKASIVDFSEAVNTYEVKYSFTNRQGKQVARGKISFGKI
ncbi:MAG: MaoC/PaaZ C-terminal domain-containing protein [Flavisolibacter sp.]